VEILKLTAGLMLPWLAGALWLAMLEARLGQVRPVSRIRQAGYGFFLGYALLCLIILACEALVGRVVWGWIVSAFFVLVLSGGIAAWRNFGRHVSIPPARGPALSRPQWMLLIALAGWILLHGVLVAVEALNQPLYPWDAWLAWVYRAKAWFLAGGLVDIVGPELWTAATSSDVYTIDAWQYPPLPSLVPYWAALSLGRWSDILINLPAVFAGVAIGLGLYGQCRESGVSPLFAVVACYLLFSIPLFGTHIALAGYADLWMAGFTGLGFTALIRGAVSGLRSQTMLGLCLLVLAVLVKNEGIVWFLAALLLHTLIAWRARGLIVLAGALVAPFIAARALGLSQFDLPLIGPVGLVDGRFQLPFIRSFALEMHDIWGPYGWNFFLLGNWHLLWVLVAAGLLVALLSRGHMAAHARRAGAAFILVFLATQLFIFGFTDQGMWADTYTAINRLPLHFVPALIYSSLLLVYLRISHGDALLAEPALTTPGLGWRPGALVLAGAMAFAVVTAGLLALTARGLPAEVSPAQRFTATNLEFVMGNGRAENEHLVVEQFANGYALLSSGPVVIEAAAYPFLHLTVDPLGNRKIPTFFWRRAGTGDQLFNRDIPNIGSMHIELATDPEWQGTISELGFLFYEDEAGGKGPMLGRIGLEPDSLSLRLQRLWAAWTAPEYWSQRSINFIWGGTERQAIHLPAPVIAWLLLTLLLTALLYLPRADQRSRFLMLSGMAAFLLAWTLLDLRWTMNGLRQTAHTLEKYHGADETQRLALGLDGEIYRFVSALKANELKSGPSRILILGDDQAIEYLLLRAKYHLLPHSALVSRRIPRGLSPSSLDYLIFLGDTSRIANTAGWNASWDAQLARVHADELGSLYRVGSEPRND
jgi:hypothetical protein